MVMLHDKVSLYQCCIDSVFLPWPEGMVLMLTLVDKGSFTLQLSLGHATLTFTSKNVTFFHPLASWSFVSSAVLLRECSGPSSRWLMKMLNRTGFQLDFMPLVTTLWAWPFIQFSTHLFVCFSNSHSNTFSVRILWKMVSKVLLKFR